MLLPGKQVPEGCETGDFVTVFIYRDSKDRLIATRKEPKLSLGEVAVLTVAQTGNSEPFLTGDWKRICFFLLRNRQPGCRRETASL